MPSFNRNKMPQVNTQNLSKAIDMVSDKVKVTKGKIEAGKLKKSQKQLYKDKVQGIADRFTSPTKLKPLIISKDNHIVDGHHRWAAAIFKWGNDVKIPIIRINLPILKAIEMYADIANSMNEDINIPINIGDTVLGGKFKNKRIVVKTIETNEKGDITINGRPFMKFRLLPKPNIFEIGDVSSKPFDFKLEKKSKKRWNYEFKTTAGSKYHILFLDKTGRGQFDLSFGVDNARDNVVTNENEPLKIMSTVIAAFKDFIKKNPDEVLTYEAFKNFEGDARRAKLYKIFLKKNLPPGYKTKESGDIVTILPPSLAKFYEGTTNEAIAKTTKTKKHLKNPNKSLDI